MLSATSGVLRTGSGRVAALGRVAHASSGGRLHACAVPAAGRLMSTLNSLNPNPALGKKNASNTSPSRIGLIGGRGYTGQALINLLNDHANMDLRYVSSRELMGTELKGYSKRKIIYDSLSPEDVARLDKAGEVDCWGGFPTRDTCRRLH